MMNPRIRFFAFIFLSFLLIIPITLVILAETKLQKFVLGGLGEKFSTKILGSSFLITNESHHSPEQLIKRMNLLGYKEVEGNPTHSGEYTWEHPLLKVHTREIKTPFESQPAKQVLLRLDKDGQWDLSDDANTALPRFYLEPAIIAELSGPQRVRRDPILFDNISPFLIQAVVAIEDHRFFKHFGLDPKGIGRALWHNIRNPSSIHGGSTITQQLAKNLFLTPKRTLRRKLMEAFLAVYLELRFSKNRILEMYLNHIYMGQKGAVSIAGVQSAARHYFDKNLEDLSLAQCALIAGLIRSPYLYNPFRNFDKAKSRRDTVLKRMFEEEFITHEDYLLARNSPLETNTTWATAQPENAYDYYIASIVQTLSPMYGEEVLYRYGLKIYTAIDPLYQQLAHEAVQMTSYQAALVAMDPHNGDVLALIGGKNFRSSQFNRATQARRQPGSAFKPFVYGAALEEGYTPISFLQDVFRGYPDGKGEIWRPKNFNNIYLGTVTLRQALAGSINAATLNLAKKLGPATIIQFARRAGISSPLEFSLAIALGVSELTLMELTSAYGPFANNGYWIMPRTVTAIVDSEDKLMEIQPVQKQSVFDPALAFLMKSLLKSVVSDGTAKRLKNLGWSGDAYGKTGTTNGGKDAWFIGFSGNLLAGVWVGDDKARPIKVAGSKNALPIWAKFMIGAQKRGQIPQKPTVPPGILVKTIDLDTGYLAKSGCPNPVKELFLDGTQPTEPCPVHAGGIKGWFRNLFNKDK